MLQASLNHIPFLLLIPIHLPDLAALFVGGACSFVLAFLLTFVVKAFCFKMGWLDRPAERRIHKTPVPRLGGVAMFLAFVIVSLLFYSPGVNSNPTEISIYWLLLIASTLMVIVHTYDDVKGLKPLPKLIAQTVAVIIIMGPWIPTFRGVLLYTFSNPFYHFRFLDIPIFREPNIYLFMQHADFSFAAIPAVLLTWFWAVGMMNTVNLIDGIDGLATGVVGITALFITIISYVLGQQSIAILAAIFTGAVLGFLPHNWNPARIFMGDSGSMFLGLGLAVLSIMGGAKLALALMVLGVPILDVAVVMTIRIRRGQSPLHYDKSHLHYRLLATGLSVKQICFLFYALTALFGVLALHLDRIYKFVGLGLVGLTMILLILWVDRRLRQRGIHINGNGTRPSPDTQGKEPADEKVAEGERITPSEYTAQAVSQPATRETLG
ncbi:MAG TPA: MraY family glycosyltransferase [Ktedonobacteraceae bacterium]|nr:MraY family glycosyltransferase [Ktedonobacteraceae bacterium]